MAWSNERLSRLEAPGMWTWIPAKLPFGTVYVSPWPSLLSGRRNTPTHLSLKVTGKAKHNHGYCFSMKSLEAEANSVGEG